MRWLVVLAACGGGGDSTPKEEPKPEPKGSAVEPPKPAPRVLKDLTVTNAGKKIEMTRAFIVRRSVDHWRVLISDSEGSCEEAREGAVETTEGATTLSLGLAKVIYPDGLEAIQIYDFRAGASKAPRAYAGVKVEAHKDDAAEVKLELPRIELDKLSIEGALVAKNCGFHGPAPVELKAQHVSAATLTIAGKKRDIKGMTLHGTDIAMSTEPLDCNTTASWAEVELRSEGGEWKLSGTWIQSAITAKTLPGTTFKVGAMGTSADGKIAAVEISGKSKIGDYPIELAGKAEALDCPTN